MAASLSPLWETNVHNPSRPAPGYPVVSSPYSINVSGFLLEQLFLAVSIRLFWLASLDGDEQVVGCLTGLRQF